MNTIMKRAIAVAGVAALALAGVPAVASAAGARLYELTENMKLTANGKFQHRKATSELIGTADAGTPLCPEWLGAPTCTINATGSDNINLATGLGNFGGTFTVVVQGDNNADSPEFVVMKGTFKGKMDFSPAIIGVLMPDGTRTIIPLGHVTGKLVADNGGGTFPFTGTFRLPFVLPAPDAYVFGGFPLPLTPMDRYDVTQTTRPLYLMDDMQNILPLQADEFAAGYATVKFEISF